MLDVHPPHHAANTWRDFFIHIATIVIGLLIAVGLEQTVEAVHRGYERRHLREDLRDEAEARVPLLKANVEGTAQDTRWLRSCMKAMLSPVPTAGYVTFTLPPRPPPIPGAGAKPENSVWEAAKASGSAALLPPPEIEAWSRIAFQEGRAERDSQAVQDAYVALEGIGEHLGVSLDPGTPIRVTPAERDELTGALGLLIAREATFNFGDAAYEGTTSAVLHGALTTKEMEPYYKEAESPIHP